MKNKLDIKHIWFDLDGTLMVHSEEYKKVHKELCYKTYAKVKELELTTKLKQDYENLYKQYGSNSALFRSLEKPSDFWQKKYNTIDKNKYLKPNTSIIQALRTIKELYPISLFSNLKPKEIVSILTVVNINHSWFTHILSGDDVKERKPALDGFYAMIDKSQIPPNEILYIGDRIKVDIIPAKKVGIKTGYIWGKADEADYSFEKFEDLLKFFIK